VTQGGALICFAIIGVDIYFVMQSLSELATLYPTTGAFTEMAGRFIDPAVSVALGWNYWYLVSRKTSQQPNMHQSLTLFVIVGLQYRC
jgi:amino acid transporter